MGRAMLIIVSGLLVALGYTFMGMSTNRSMLTEQSVDRATKFMSRNLAHTGVQLAIGEFENDNSWRGPKTITLEDGQVDISIREVTPNTIIEITSEANFNQINHTIISTYDISQQQSLVPAFSSTLGITTDNFNFFLGGSTNISGYDDSGQCADAPGVQVTSQSGKNTVGNNSRIDGTPEDQAEINSSISYAPYATLVQRLAQQPGVQRISGNYKGNLGTRTNPGIFFIEDRTKLTGGIKEGFGVMVVRSGGELNLDGQLDIAGNFTFNGLVIFENAWKMNARGTPTINGSIVVGNTEESNIDIDINGNVQLQYDCTAKQYADLAVDEQLDGNRTYRQVSIYE